MFFRGGHPCSLLCAAGVALYSGGVGTPREECSLGVPTPVPCVGGPELSMVRVGLGVLPPKAELHVYVVSWRRRAGVLWEGYGLSLCEQEGPSSHEVGE